MKIRLLVDADYYVYLAGRKFETTVDWGDGIISTSVDLDAAKLFIRREIDGLQNTLGADHVTISLSCPTEKGFRRHINPGYKMNRVKALRPAGYSKLREFLLAEYEHVCAPELEADDVIGILATKVGTGEDRIIVSVDKDFNTIPADRIDPMHLEKGIICVTEEEAYKNFVLQAIIGDKADGYAGCPGVGPVTAKRLLADKEPAEYWPAIVEAYVSKGYTEEDALLNARMAYILHDQDYNSKTKEVVLWSPA